MKITSTFTCKSLLMAFLILFVQSAFALNQLPANRGDTVSNSPGAVIYFAALITVLSFIIDLILLCLKLKSDSNRLTDKNVPTTHSKAGIQAADSCMQESKIKSNSPLKLPMSYVPETSALKRLKKFEDNLEYLSKDITPTTLAALLNINTKYTPSIILKTRGKNTVDYLNALKINYIIGLLRTEPKYRHYTQKALSAEAGFRSQKTFTRPFKTTSGMNFNEFIEVYGTAVTTDNNLNTIRNEQ